jgi:hypothetical protein
MDCPTVFDEAKMTMTAFLETLDFRYSDDLQIDDMETIREVKTRTELLKSAYDEGGTLAKTLRKKMIASVVKR